MVVKLLTKEQKERMSDAIASFGHQYRVEGGSIIEDPDTGKKIVSFGLSCYDVSEANVKAMAKKIAQAGIFAETEFNEIHHGGIKVWPAI